MADLDGHIPFVVTTAWVSSSSRIRGRVYWGTRTNPYANKKRRKGRKSQGRAT